MPVSNPGWVPPGQMADEGRYRYDFKTGWVPPGEKSSRTRSQVVMPAGFDPREDSGFEVVVSPPGQRAPEGISYTPATDELHGLGESPPIQRSNYTIIPAGKPRGQVPPGTPTGFPMPDLPQAPQSPLPTPGGSQSLPPGMGGGPPMGRTPPPVPPLNLGGSTPLPQGPAGGMPTGPGMAPPPATPPLPPGVGPPVGMGQDSGQVRGIGSIARSLIAALIPPEPVGIGQDVGVGADDLNELQTQALQARSRQHVGTPYVYGGNDLAKGIDCSGFVNEILRGFGAPVTGRPTTTTYRNQLSDPVSWDNVRPGDILLSAANPGNPGTGEHMALYVGGGQMAESRGGTGVRIGSVQGTNLRPYRLRASVPGLQDATRLAQAAGREGPTTVTPTSDNNPVRLLSAEGGVGDVRSQILAEAQRRFGPEGARAVGAIMAQEVNINRMSRGDNGRSAGPFQFFGPGGQLDGYARTRGVSLADARTRAERDPLDAANYAFDTYMGTALRRGLDAGHSSEQLVGDIVRGGQNPRANVGDYVRHVAGVQLPSAVQGAAQAVMNIPANVLDAARGGIEAILSATASPAHAQEGGASPPRRIPPEAQWPAGVQPQVAAAARLRFQEQDETGDDPNKPVISYEEAYGQAAQQYFAANPVAARPAAQAPAAPTTNAGTLPQGRATEATSPTPALTDLDPAQRRRYDEEVARANQRNITVNENDLIRAVANLPPLGEGRPGSFSLYPLGDRQIILGIFRADGGVDKVPPAILKYEMEQALGTAPATPPLTITSQGYTFTQPQRDPNSPNWIVAHGGSLVQWNKDTNETTPIYQGTPDQHVTIRQNPSGTATEVWTTDDQGNARRIATDPDALAVAKERFSQNVSTSGGVTTITDLDRLTGATNVSRDYDPRGQRPEIRGSGNRVSISDQQWSPETGRYETSTEFRTAPPNWRDVYEHGVTNNSTGSYARYPVYDEEGRPTGQMRQVLIPGSQGAPHFDSPSGAIYSTTGGNVEQIGQMPTRRAWRQVRDPFGGIGMMDQATGDFVPIRQAAPKIVKYGRRAVMLVPPTLQPMKGIGSHVQDLAQIPWQVKNLSPRAMEIFQGMMQGAGAAPADVPPTGAAPIQPPTGTPQGFQRPTLEDTSPETSADEYGDPYGDDATMDPGQYRVAAPSRSEFGLPDTMRLPEPQYYEAQGDFEDVGDTSTVGYDGEDEDYYSGSYDDEEDEMNRRRRVGVGQGYEETEEEAHASALAAYDAAMRTSVRGRQAGASPYNGGPPIQDPYGEREFGVVPLPEESAPRKGFSTIKGDDGRIYSFNEDTGELATVAGGSGREEREFGLKERQIASSERQSAEASALGREKLEVDREQNRIAADPRKFRLQPHMIDLGRGGTAVYDPETGMVQQVSPREPESVRNIGKDVYVPAGQSVDVQYGLRGDPGYGTPTRISGGAYSGWVPTRNTPGLPFGATGGPAGGVQGGGGSTGATGGPGGGYRGGPGGSGGMGGAGYSNAMGASGYGGMGGSPGGGQYGAMGGAGGVGGYGGGAPYSGVGPGVSSALDPNTGWSPSQAPPGPPVPPGPGASPPTPPGWLDMGAVQQSFRPQGWESSWPGGNWSNGPGALW